MADLDRAVEIAKEAHAGQLDKGGKPYIDHCLRVMGLCRQRDERIVAVLHDVIEDSQWTLDDLRREGFSEIVVEAVGALTRRDNEPYSDFIERVGRNPVAAIVKIADLTDNMDLSRLSSVSETDHQRNSKYARALGRLASLAPIA